MLTINDIDIPGICPWKMLHYGKMLCRQRFPHFLIFSSLGFCYAGENEIARKEPEKDAIFYIQNLATFLSWVGAAGLFVGFLLFPFKEEKRILFLLTSLLILLFFVILKLILHTVDKCWADKGDKKSKLLCEQC